ncbi:hypothetical protein SDC9_203649 [bioreactor metagenome]|uniref:Uncharacterized protein n=1 Tax=bioreactor metagenome TaxID=1076179 RepID=A0A645IX18_9ZZZZ
MQVTGEHTLLHDIRFLSGSPFIIHIHRPAVERNGTVVNHTDVFIAYFFVQLIREDRDILTVEVGLKSMTDSLVQQNA